MGKQRNGFVTNSSSSSFIFDNSWSIESVYGLLVNSSESLLKLKKYLDEILEDSRYSERLDRLRENSEDFSVMWELEDALMADKALEQCMTTQLNDEKLDIGYMDFIDFYTDNWDIDKIEKLVELQNYDDFKHNPAFEMCITDLAKTNEKLRGLVMGILTWYLDDYDDDNYDEYMEFSNGIYSLTTDDAFAMAREKLGQIVIDSWCGNIPSILVEIMRNYTSKQCNHMG